MSIAQNRHDYSQGRTSRQISWSVSFPGWLEDGSTWTEVAVVVEEEDWAPPCTAIISSLLLGIVASGGCRLTASAGVVLGFCEQSERFPKDGMVIASGNSLSGIAVFRLLELLSTDTTLAPDRPTNPPMVMGTFGGGRGGRACWRGSSCGGNDV